MISVISHKHDLISYGFYKGFKTIYKDVDIYYNEGNINKIVNSKIILINNYDFFDKIPINKNTIYVLINENCIFETKLKNENCKYFIIKEYDSSINYNNFKKLDKYCYINNNIIIIPYGSIYTKNEILWNYKKKLIKKKSITYKINTFDTIPTEYIKDITYLNYEKINLKTIDNILLYSTKSEIFLSFSNKNRFDYKSITFMSFGNLSMTNSILNNKNFNILNMDNKNPLKFDKMVQNIETIYNDFTFEKYVKLINNYFLSLV